MVIFVYMLTVLFVGFIFLFENDQNKRHYLGDIEQYKSLD